MPDLDEGLRGVDRVSAPDLWDAIEVRSRSAPPKPKVQRIATVVVALAVAAASIAVLVVTFGEIDHRPAVRPGENGLIVYTASGPQPPSIPFENVDVFALDPATGERVNLTNTPTVAERSPVWSPDGSKVLFQRTTASGEGAEFEITRDLVLANADFTAQSVIQDCAEGCNSFDVAWSPDGSRLAFPDADQVDDGYRPVLRILELASGATTMVACEWPTCQSPGQPAWSPDGSRIAFSQAGGIGSMGPLLPWGPIWVADVAGGRVTPLTEAPEECRTEQRDACIFDSEPTWSPDGGSIAFVHTTGRGQPGATTEVVVTGVDGSGLRVLSRCVSSDQCLGGPVAWAPDGNALAFIDRYDRPTLHLLDPETALDRTIDLPESVGHPYSVLWSPDSSQLAFLGGGRLSDLFAVDLATGEVRSVAPQLTPQGDLAWLPASAIEPAESTGPSEEPTVRPETAVPAGTIVFNSSNGSNNEDAGSEIWTIDTDGSGLIRLTDNETFDGDAAISADGARIAFASYRSGDRNTQVYLMNADGTDQHALTDRRTGATQPAWSPDGSRIAFISSEGYGEPGGILVMNANGSDQRVVAEGNAFDPAWSPDGSRIIFALNEPNGQTHLWVVDLATGVEQELSSLPGEQTEPTWSPDGQTIAFRWGSEGGEAIFTMRQDGSELRKVADGSEPTWSPDGSWLAFTSVNEEMGPQIWLVDALGRGAHALTSMDGFVNDSQIYAQTGSPSWTGTPS